MMHNKPIETHHDRKIIINDCENNKDSKTNEFKNNNAKWNERFSLGRE